MCVLNIVCFTFIWLVLMCCPDPAGGSGSWASASFRRKKHSVRENLLDVKNASSIFKSFATVYLISNVREGGARKYAQDIARAFPDVYFVPVSSREVLMRSHIRNCDIVFVNHLIHTEISVSDVLEVKKATGATLIAVVHDFYWMSNGKHQINTDPNDIHGAYLAISTLPKAVNELFLECHSIIVVSEFARARFANLYNGSNFVSVHPIDYAVSRDKVVYPKVENRTINIGHLLAPSVYKGIDAVLLLRSLYTTYRNYTVNIKIAGLNGMATYEDNMRGFHSLLESERIHGLLYLSRWGETFSFGMTKYLNSKLPILYNNFGAFKERLVNTVGTFAVYQDEADYDELLHTHPPQNDLKSRVAKRSGPKFNRRLFSTKSQKSWKMRRTHNLTPGIHLRGAAAGSKAVFDGANGTAASKKLLTQFESFLDTIIENNGDDYTYSEPKEEIPAFFNTLFRTNFTKENLVLITSKIRVSEAPFSYRRYRSVYSLDERFQQTVQTIKSIRDYIPNSCIVLIDNSEDLPSNYTDYLNGNADVFVTSSSKTLKFFTDVNKFKAFAELAQMIELYNMILYRIDVGSFKNIFKISGRYTVLPTFDIEQYNALPNTDVFKRDESVTDRQYYYTCFYKIAPQHFHAYFQTLKGIFAARDDYISRKMLDLEVMIPQALNYSFTQVKTLGIRQNVAVWNASTSI